MAINWVPGVLLPDVVVRVKTPLMYGSPVDAEHSAARLCGGWQHNAKIFCILSGGILSIYLFLYVRDEDFACASSIELVYVLEHLLVVLPENRMQRGLQPLPRLGLASVGKFLVLVLIDPGHILPVDRIAVNL